ncbi:hypothetical protein RchiOBHm_Chr4g0398401 [Rosa chinensis]|uniref:Uncharacterized protein n=1 Tax=Rosa chinensis TaxID=74649 RepID=A0A2P6QSA6_ROSCH|nr:hypothetical protein RchiOBHm_Chr4g0398401 [Rosa chinensis]
MGFGFVEVLSSWSTGLALGVLVRFRNLQAQDPKEEAKSETRDWINTVACD